MVGAGKVSQPKDDRVTLRSLRDLGRSGTLRPLRKVVGRLYPLEALPDRQWCRVVVNRRVGEFIDSLPPERCAAVEVSGELHRPRPWKSYRSLWFPEFDLCSSNPDETFDVVICEQVLEHVIDPWRAARTLRQLTRPGGHILVSTPFLIRVHGEPVDFWRFTQDGLRVLLESADLEVVNVESWGNRACVRGNFRYWAPYRGWRSLRNEPAYPVMVWALARRND